MACTRSLWGKICHVVISGCSQLMTRIFHTSLFVTKNQNSIFIKVVKSPCKFVSNQFISHSHMWTQRQNSCNLQFQPRVYIRHIILSSLLNSFHGTKFKSLNSSIHQTRFPVADLLTNFILWLTTHDIFTLFSKPKYNIKPPLGITIKFN